ncbi:MAG: VWA domain-containing protein [Pseudomonadota bacterium]
MEFHQPGPLSEGGRGEDAGPTYFLVPDWNWEKRRQAAAPALNALRRLVLPRVRRGLMQASVGAGRARERVAAYRGGREPLALEAALERIWPERPETFYDLPVVIREERGPGLVVMLDTSLSMAGPGRVAAAVAAAALCRLAAPGRLGLAGFGERARTVIAWGRRVRPLEAAYRVLGLALGGVTDLAAGLRQGHRLMAGAPPGAAAVLITDAERTAGADPRALAGRFARLHVVLLGGRNLGLGRDLARRGGGRLLRVDSLAQLPGALGRLVRDLERGI